MEGQVAIQSTNGKSRVEISGADPLPRDGSHHLLTQSWVSTWVSRHEFCPRSTTIDEPRDSTPAPPNVTPITDPSTRDVLLQIQKQCSALNSRLARLEKQATQRTTPQRASTPAPLPPEHASPSYANAVREPPKPNPSPQPQSQAAPAARPQATPSTADLTEGPRFVVRFMGKGPHPDNRDSPLIISRKINTRLAATPSAGKLQVLGSYWNESNNIILTFPPRTSLKLIQDHIPSIRQALSLPDTIPISRDIFLYISPTIMCPSGRC
ncbi:hypothetical protein EV715DRAFT_297391 [Schizophyllum commune]